LLHTLAAMGHGDELALVDAHFPAVSMARRLVRLDGADLPDVLAACLHLMPLDTFVPDPALRMEMVDHPKKIPDAQELCQKVIDKAEGRHVALAGIERHAGERNWLTRSLPLARCGHTDAFSSKRAWRHRSVFIRREFAAM
jgi:L-fucose mutarotase